MKRQFIKKIFSSAMIFILLLGMLTSCNRRYNEEEVLSAAKELLKAAEKLNYVYYGEGIRYLDGEETLGIYKEADAQHLSELGFSSVAELKILTEKTFSKEYSNIMYSSILDTLRNGENIVGYKRYYDVKSKTGEQIVMVNTVHKPLLNSTIVYNYDSIKVERVKREKIFLNVNATVSDKNGSSRSVDITITLVEEEAGWRIDNPVYANY